MIDDEVGKVGKIAIVCGDTMNEQWIFFRLELCMVRRPFLSTLHTALTTTFDHLAS